VTDRWFSPGTPVSSTNKTGFHDIGMQDELEYAHCYLFGPHPHPENQ
jgi:hypothetical protein